MTTMTIPPHAAQLGGRVRARLVTAARFAGHLAGALVTVVLLGESR